MKTLSRIATASVIWLGLSASAAAADDAWIVLSIAKDMSFGTVELRIRSEDDHAIGTTVGFNPLSVIGRTSHNWGEKKSGFVVSRKVAPGRYEIFNFCVHYTPVKTDFWAKKDFSVPFVINAGEVAYLGEFMATGTVMKPVIVIPNVKRPYFLWSDQQARDMAIAVEENEALKALPVRTISFASQDGPFIRTRRMPED